MPVGAGLLVLPGCVLGVERRVGGGGWVFGTLLGPEESGAGSGGCPGVGLVVSWCLIIG